MRFVAVQFPEDPKVSDKIYWYLCEIEVEEGDFVLAPLGSHNRLQRGVVKEMKNCKEEDAPFPVPFIKRVIMKTENE